METTVEIEPPPQPSGDDEMAKFSGVTLAAWRSRASHALQVDIGVAATACAQIDVKEMDGSESADVLVLTLSDDGTKTELRPWFTSHSKENAPIYKYVVLLDGATILAVAPVADVP